MRNAILKNTGKACCVIFGILLAVHAFEAIVLRMDESFFGENFINKLFGIFVIGTILRILHWKWRGIGFSGSGLFRNIAMGTALAAAAFAAAYAVELLVLKSQGARVRFGFFVTGFSLTGQSVVNRGAGFILMCVCFNIINVIMEEGTFRGLFFGILHTDRSAKTAVLIQALLFGIWHIVTPLHNLIDGEIGIGGFIGLSAGYVILAGLMGIKWAFLYQLTGSLYAGMADHFFNNCIATNLLHLTTESGTDEMMLLRVLIAQMLSFAAVMIIRTKQKKKCRQQSDGDPSQMPV